MKMTMNQCLVSLKIFPEVRNEIQQAFTSQRIQMKTNPEEYRILNLLYREKLEPYNRYIPLGK